MTLRFALAALALVLSTPAPAILTRVDRDDAEYLELATRYPSSILLGLPEGEGTLIGPRWVLTAAHRARALQESKPVPLLAIGKGRHEIEAIFIHPEWKPGSPADIALVLLKTPVEDIEPTPIYRASDESGKVVRIVGHGYSGRLGEQPARERWDRKARAAINTVDRVTPRGLAVRIKPADEASDLQGAATPSDSGGPAFVETREGIFVAGVGYASEDTNANGLADNGDWELFVRVSAFVAWIDEVTARPAREALEAAAREAAAAVGDTERK